MSDNPDCVVCAGRNLSPLLDIERAPVWCSGLCRSRSSALTIPTAPISLTLCHDCGHLFNQKYESVQYGDEYDSSLDFSPTFQSYAQTLADLLVERYSLSEKTVIEIGCGRGDFLRMLCSRGTKRGIGFDPSYPPELPVEISSAISVYRENFPSATHAGLCADFFCSRHTLEHIGDPRTFLSALRAEIGAQRRPVFFEVPNSLYTLRDGGIWDIIYEHRSYFSPISLARLFWECDFEPAQVEETYASQFLTIHATAQRSTSSPPKLYPGEFERLVGTFRDSYQAKLTFWQYQARALERAKSKVVAWGAGAKTTMFLNLVRPSAIDYVVDINPRKQGNFLIGTGQQIMPPEFLQEYRPDMVILTNHCYSSEVRQTLRTLDVTPELLLA
jgi:hypothetical protein